MPVTPNGQRRAQLRGPYQIILIDYIGICKTLVPEVAGPDRRALLDGEVVVMAPIGNRHLVCVNRLTRLLVVGVGERAIVSVHNPVRLDDRSELQPDVVLLRRGADDPTGPVPSGGDSLLVVEVADSSLAWDRDGKAPRYAAAAIPACWIVDLPAGEILVLSWMASTSAWTRCSASVESLPARC
jgi:Uma2 family endonuclease